MLLVHGHYRFGAKRIAYRNDYCLRCDSVRMALLFRTFDVGHLFFVPLLPLGHRRRWRCSTCGHDPHERVASSQGIKLLAAVAFGIFAAVAWLVPITRPEDAASWWSFRTAMTLGFLGALAWCRTMPPTNLKEQLRNVPPLPLDACVFCGGSLDARGFCYSCEVTRLDVT
jgi:hypothetical protein